MLVPDVREIRHALMLHVVSSNSVGEPRILASVLRSRPLYRNINNIQRRIHAESDPNRQSREFSRIQVKPDFVIPPPPPPPPPPRPNFDYNLDDIVNRRNAIGALGAGVVAIALASGLTRRRPSAEYERELSYVASQIGIPGMPSPVSAVIDTSTGGVVGIEVLGASGQEYLATVDPRNPSVLLLKTSVGKGKVRSDIMYRLQTRFENVNLNNRRMIESIFRVPNWESLLR
eukprot:jgi/Picsp_1/871/NSC_04359-R1_---NA---